jgi:hypothetical protein
MRILVRIDCRTPHITRVAVSQSWQLLLKGNELDAVNLGDESQEIRHSRVDTATYLRLGR